MRTKKYMVPMLILGFLTSVLFSNALLGQEKQKKEQEKIFIPAPVKTVLQEGLEARQARQDIPFTLIKHIFLPASSGFHNVFFFKAKNSSLGFAAPTPAPEKEENKKEKQETAPAFKEETPAQIEAKLNIFLQFNRLEKDTPPQIAREVYIPASLQTDSASYDPEKEEIYSVGFPLASGNYLLAMAITSIDLSKIGTFYFEFSIPDPATYASALETTPIFFIKNMEQLPAVETRAEVHKGNFVYSVLKIEPNIDNVFALGENLDIFFFILGAKPNDQQQYSIEVTYEVKDGEKTAIKYEATTYPNPLISQPLPLKQTVLIKTEKEEKKEVRDLAAGHYTLVIQITDKISGLTTTKNVEFDVK